jgi:hypothetical protein
VSTIVTSVLVAIAAWLGFWFRLWFGIWFGRIDDGGFRIWCGGFGWINNWWRSKGVTDVVDAFLTTATTCIIGTESRDGIAEAKLTLPSDTAGNISTKINAFTSFTDSTLIAGDTGARVRNSHTSVGFAVKPRGTFLLVHTIIRDRNTQSVIAFSICWASHTCAGGFGEHTHHLCITRWLCKV